MVCDICKSNPAVVHLKQVCDGETREVNVCMGCAEEKGLDVDSSMSLQDFLFGPGGGPSPLDELSAKTSELACPDCGMKIGEFRDTSRLGCASCYTAFADDIVPYLCSMHVGDQHRGKAPQREQLLAGVADLERQLSKAVASQKFEEAARLRDAIKEMAESGADSNGAEVVK